MMRENGADLFVISLFEILSCLYRSKTTANSIKKVQAKLRSLPKRR